MEFHLNLYVRIRWLFRKEIFRRLFSIIVIQIDYITITLPLALLIIILIPWFIIIHPVGLVILIIIFFLTKFLKILRLGIRLRWTFFLNLNRLLVFFIYLEHYGKQLIRCFLPVEISSFRWESPTNLNQWIGRIDVHFVNAMEAMFPNLKNFGLIW